MDNSLTNYLHRLAPEMTAEDYQKRQLSIFVFCRWCFDLQAKSSRRRGTARSQKHKNRPSRALLSSTNEIRGKIYVEPIFVRRRRTAYSGNALAQIELRPYIKTSALKVGDLIAQGELQVTVIKPKTDEKLSEIHPSDPTALENSKDTYDTEKIRKLNQKIAENFYKDVTSIVVIKNGELLIEEYFNGADRDSLHNTRSVGKSFASAMMGIAINDGYIKSENQTLKDFYNLTKFANYSTKKDSVTIKSLLTMSSGFDGNDDEENSPGNEEKMYPTNDWIKFALDLPMDDNKEVGKTGITLPPELCIRRHYNKSVPKD